MKRTKQITRRYAVMLIAFLLPLVIAGVLRRLSITFDLGILFVAAIVGAAWYGGTVPGLIVAVLFELIAVVLALSNPTNLPIAKLVFAEVNRTALLVLFALLAGARKKAETRLREHREWLQVTLSSIADGVIATDLKGLIRFMNPSAEALTGWTAAQATSGPLDQVFQIVHKESNQKVENPILKMIRERDIRVETGEVVLSSRDRKSRPIDYGCAPIRDQRGEATGVVLVFRDVTKQEQLQDQLRQSQKMEAIGRLAGGIAHDFNNLLTAIIGYSDLLLREIGSDEKFRAQLEEIGGAGRRAAVLISQLLAFSRKQVLQPKVFDLNEAVLAIENMLRRLIGEDIDLVTATRSGLGRVRADPGQIEQILMNLAVNSRDAMPNGGKLTIETANIELDEAYARAHPEVTPGRYVMLAVSDTGQGMDAETQSKIFEPFFTTKEQGKGTGLGLSTVFGIVKQSGGNIWVYSEPGHGVVFKIYFPRVDEAADSTDAPMETAQSLYGRETIMLVEDDESVRRLSRTLLEMYGYTVLTAEAGAQALEAFGPLGTAIDLVITDVVMPQMSGADLVARLKEMHPEVKVLYVSGYTEEATIHRGVINKDVEFLEKPFTPEGLARRIRQILDRHCE